MCFETERQRIQSREFHAIIRCQASDEDIRYLSLLQEFAEASGFAVSIVEEAAIAVDASVSAFLKDIGKAVSVQTRSEVRARSILDAMVGPKRLGQAIQVNLIEGFSARMVRSKAAVIGRVPVLSHDYKLEQSLDMVGHGNHSIAIRNCQSTSREEIILDVNQD